MRKQAFLIIVFLPLVFYSCLNSQEGNQSQDSSDAQDIPLTFSFTSSLPPFYDSSGFWLLRNMNNLSIAEAKAKGKDRVTLYAVKDSSGKIINPELPADVKFFPVMSDSAMMALDNDKAARVGFPSQIDTNNIHSIDFKRNFVLVVAHPPAIQNGFYSDNVATAYEEGHILYVSLSYYFMQSRYAASYPFWHNSVFKMSKKNYEKLGVVLNQDTTFFSLAD
ncbi:MAG: hypothetical protein ABI237_08385 [Ginsengibacter sp.]